MKIARILQQAFRTPETAPQLPGLRESLGLSRHFGKPRLPIPASQARPV